VSGTAHLAPLQRCCADFSLAAAPALGIFIVEGLLTVVVGFLAYFLVPTWPSKTKFLTTREKAILEHRLQEDSDAYEEQGFQWREVRRAFTSPQVYGYCFLFHGFAFPLYTLSLFLPWVPREEEGGRDLWVAPSDLLASFLSHRTIIQGLGYKSWEAQLLTTPVSTVVKSTRRR
jgi:hypothetical protein